MHSSQVLRGRLRRDGADWGRLLLVLLLHTVGVLGRIIVLLLLRQCNKGG